MPAEGRKARPQTARPARRRLSKKREANAKSARSEVDILSPVAMENVYYISHNAMDCLEFRGFGWPEAHRKKGNTARKPKSRK